MKQKLKKLISYYNPYKFLFFSDMLFAIVGAAVTLVIPLLVRYVTNTVVYFELTQAKRMIFLIGILLLIFVAVEMFCNFYIAYYGHQMGARMESDMRNEIFCHYQKLSFSYFNDQKVGQMMSRITSDLFEISELLHHGPEDLVISIIRIVGSFAILLTVNVKLALLAFSFIPVMTIFAVLYNRKMKRAFKRNREKIAAINEQIEDSLSGIRVVKSFANEKEEIRKFEEGNQNYVKAKKNSYRYMGIYFSGLGALSTLITVAVLILGVNMLLSNQMKVTDLITFILYVGNFTDPVKKLVAFTEQFQNGITGFERFQEILSVEPEDLEKNGKIQLEAVQGAVEFQNVTFCYEQGQAPVFEHLNLHVNAGEYVAMVGPSGVGKTTLCSLIPRFYDATEGAIFIDGKDIKTIQLESLRNHIGIVQQDIYLFAGTIMDNIRYGKPGATDDEVIQAAKRANAHAFISEFPEGYQTYIGQRGVKLSGGQKQRISIARVFLKNPEVLIFDEATSALDNESEKIVQESMDELAKDRTTFVIAHRLSTIRNAKRILVLTEKGIEESGTHEQLMEKNGIYASLYNMQFRKENRVGE